MKSENAIKNERYRGILFIIYMFKGITKTHLRFLFLENHGVEITGKNRRLTKNGKKIAKSFGKFFKYNFYDGKDTFRNDIYYGKILGPRIKINTADNYLSKILRKLRNTEPFPIIKRVKKQGQKATYELTPEGRRKFIEYLLFWLINNYSVSTEFIENIIGRIIMEHSKFEMYELQFKH